MVDNITIGARLHDFREKAGYSQQSIAGFLNVDQSFISKIEKGERSISVEMLDKLTSLLGVMTSDIVSSNAASTSLCCAFRCTNLTADDMEAISAINKIALNAKFMSKLQKENLA